MLAVSSFIFITLATVTGLILAFEPIDNQLKGYHIDGADNLSLATTLHPLKEKYAEILSLEVDGNGFISVSVIDEEGNMGDFYINPFTGEKIGDLIEKPALFEFATSLHRSLFLKSTGRLLVGLCAFFLLLITVTGIILIIKRQQGIRNFFASIIKEDFYQYYHVYLGRLTLVPILVITLTGTYLSLERFSLLPEAVMAAPEVDIDQLAETPEIAYRDFPIFQSIKLEEVRSVEFPFSPFVEDLYTISLKTKEINVNQLTGEVVASSPYPLVTIFSNLSLSLHTGQGSIWWSTVLGLSCLGILFFIFSGFKMTFKRRKSRLKNTFSKNNSEYIILVGSETGSTIQFAGQLQQKLIETGKSVYLAEMNSFSAFAKMKHLIVFTATYGQGEPPANARKFLSLFRQYPPQQPFHFSVVGFGSLAYPDFCQFAKDVNAALADCPQAQQQVPLFTINNRSWESFVQWVTTWNDSIQAALPLPLKKPAVKPVKKKLTFKVVDKTLAHENPDDTFLIKLQSTKRKKYISGDLLAIYPSKEDHERLYSVAVTREKHILLSIKRHEMGICSNYLNSLVPGDCVPGNIVKNPDFYFPKKGKRVILISTGTGIAPFLGMLEQNQNKVETHLFWGARTAQSFDLHAKLINSAMSEGTLTRFIPAYSRQDVSKVYVQHLIERESQLMAKTLREKGVIMICGSVAMQKAVISQLEQIVHAHHLKPLSYYQNKKQLRMDCY
ncbi:hypothetical protein GCM10011339_43310 [Echinicola rosea]|uniref:FAD-binding oxidoreductase n=2 Tax=Echinicola rosea TaxID=1807691 RepID=A0ABQ1VAV7_9BACT|nr:hypothetical protein GCM10011339_43310 [Echinicola rosea]